MSICLVSYDLSKYLGEEEEALKHFTSCLPEYRDVVANEVFELFSGGKEEEEFWHVFAQYEEQEDLREFYSVFAQYRFWNTTKGVDNQNLLWELVEEALEFYSQHLYMCSMEEMVEDGEDIKDWIRGSI